MIDHTSSDRPSDRLRDEGLCTKCSATQYCEEHQPRQEGQSMTDRGIALSAVRLAKEATNGWACVAKGKIEHDEISRLHRAIGEIEEQLNHACRGGTAFHAECWTCVSLVD